MIKTSHTPFPTTIGHNLNFFNNVITEFLIIQHSIFIRILKGKKLTMQNDDDDDINIRDNLFSCIFGILCLIVLGQSWTNLGFMHF